MATVGRRVMIGVLGLLAAAAAWPAPRTVHDRNSAGVRGGAPLRAGHGAEAPDGSGRSRWIRSPASGHRVSRLRAVQVAYLTSCGGCHGVEGVSAPKAVPTLRHLTGSFLCTRQGRRFIVRLPDVALSSLSDRMLTKVMNWVVFDMGAPVAGGSKAHRYTVAEVARLRREPLTQNGLTPYREQVVARIEARCAVPAALNVYGEAYAPGVKSSSPKR
jgi:cytochrome c553